MQKSGIFNFIKLCQKTVGFLLMGAWALGAAHGATLHVGDRVMGLDIVRRTQPGLAVKIADGVWWGALYPGAAPGKTLHVGEYWVGQNCASGAYSTDGLATCTDCGMGHYCTGAMHRETCTYGAIGCPGMRHGTDGELPDGAPINAFMEFGDVEKYIPPTDIAQWRVVSCCYQQSPGGVFADWRSPDTLNDVNAACADGILGPGTYLFATQYSYSDGRDTPVDAISGGVGNASAFIAVFDHPVGYRSIHGNSIFQHFIDTNNAPFKSWTLSTAPVDGNWFVNINLTNISNIKNSILYDSAHLMCVFELQ